MKELPDNSVDLIITSPPYWDIKKYHQDGGQNPWFGKGKVKTHSLEHEKDFGRSSSYEEYIANCLLTWKECFRVLKPGRKFCLNAPSVSKKNKQPYSLSYDLRKSILEQTQFKFFNLFVWHKKSRPFPYMSDWSFPLPGRIFSWFSLTEDLIVFTKPGNPQESYDEEKAAKSALTQERLLQIINPVWNVYVPRKKKSEHSAVMSLEVCSRLIEAYSFWGDLVLDPFCGTGTTLRAAQQLGRHWVGYELYQHYQTVIEQKLGLTKARINHNLTTSEFTY